MVTSKVIDKSQKNLFFFLNNTSFSYKMKWTVCPDVREKRADFLTFAYRNVRAGFKVKVSQETCWRGV